MFHHKSGETVRLHQYFIPAILILATFVIGSVLTIYGIRSIYYGILDEQSTQYAQNYAERITKATQATDVINSLLEEKLITACKTIALYEDNIGESVLADLAHSLQLDELYYYNLDGEIIHSNHGRYLGWTSYPGHPVENFRVGNLDFLVENIRPDTESGVLFKYAYFRTPRGFFQLGISAQTVEKLLHAFEPARLLTEIAGADKNIVAVSFLNQDFIVEKSSKPNLIGQQLKQPAMEDAILANKTYSGVADFEGKSVYQAYTPVLVGGKRIGALMIAQSLKPTQRLINMASTFGIAAAIIIIAALFYSLYITYRRKKELLFMAHHHSATGLPNRRFLQNILRKTNTDGSSFFLVHYRGLSDIGHIYGFRFVDQIFTELAGRLQKTFGEQHQFFHFSDDRLAFFIQNKLTREEQIKVAERVIQAGVSLLKERGLQGQLDIRIAILKIANTDHPPKKIFTDASLALLYHPENSPVPYSFFSSDMQTKLLREKTIEQELRSFLIDQKRACLRVEYQPIVDLKTNQIVSFEALTRLHSAELGPISPLEFIEIAERRQLIAQLDLWVLEQASKFLNRLDQAGFSQIKIAINISGTELLNEDFINRIQQAVQKNNVDPKRLKLEVTESVMFAKFTVIAELFKELKNMGITIAIDDFGTGYSSFARLEELSTDLIKIDKSFIDRILTRNHDQLIIGDLIAMCHKMGLQVVAEGVEKESQRQYLLKKGCDFMQGFLFSRPLPPEQALQKIKGLN